MSTRQQDADPIYSGIIMERLVVATAEVMKKCLRKVKRVELSEAIE